MKTIEIQNKLVGFPLDENGIEQPAALLDYSLTSLGDPWYRFREAEGKIHDGGHWPETTAQTDQEFEDFLIQTLDLVKI